MTAQLRLTKCEPRMDSFFFSFSCQDILAWSRKKRQRELALLNGLGVSCPPQPSKHNTPEMLVNVTRAWGRKEAEAKPSRGAHVQFAPLPHKVELNTPGGDHGVQGRIFSRRRKESQGWSWHLGCISALSPACLGSTSSSSQQCPLCHTVLGGTRVALIAFGRSTGSHISWVKAHQKLEGKFAERLSPPQPPALLQGWSAERVCRLSWRS